MTPVVSIVTPAFNAAKYVDETIDSVQAQTWSDWEWIIVDDGSTDATSRILDSRAERDNRIRIIHQQNRGVSAARNRGLAAAAGPLFALLDADDLWSPENLARKVETLEAEPLLLFAYSNMYRHLQRTGETVPSAPGKADNQLENLLLWNGDVIPAICSNVVFRRSAFDGGLRFDPRFSTAADLDFGFRLAKLGAGRLLCERLLTYRVLPDSMSRDLALVERDLIAVYENAGALGLYPSRLFRRRCFAQLCLILAGSWWTDGDDKRRAVGFMLRAARWHPWAVGQLARKAGRCLASARV